MALFELSRRSRVLTDIRATIGALFGRLNIPPDLWTFITLIAAVIAAYLIILEQFILGALFIAVSGFFDVVDGAVARHTGRVTKMGAYLDTIADRYAEFLYLLPLFFLPLPAVAVLPPNVWAALCLFGAMTTTYAKAAAKEKELGIEEIRGGILERAERVSLLFVGFLSASVDITYLSYVIIILAVLANISALQRINKTLSLAAKTVKKDEKRGGKR